MIMEACLVGAGTLLVALGLLLVLAIAIRRPHPDEEPEPEPEHFVLATVGPSYRPVPQWHDLVQPVPARHRRDDAETSVLYVVPALCGCLDGGIRSLLDRSDPWCRRCGGAC